MVQYDGSIHIVTKITTKDAEESLANRPPQLLGTLQKRQIKQKRL